MSTHVRDNEHNGERFVTTRWSIVLAAGQGTTRESKQALDSLCETYWPPVYAYVRRLVTSVQEAQDLTQGFFVNLLEKDAIARIDPDRGRFRTFLLAAIRNYVSNERAKARSEKRGGDSLTLSLDLDAGGSSYQIEPSHLETPEKLFERRWVLTLIDQVLDGLKMELAAAGKELQFETLKEGLLGQMTEEDYLEAADKLDITATGARQAAYRMRKRYRDLFRQEVARTVADDADVDHEIGRLLQTLSE